MTQALKKQIDNQITNGQKMNKQLKNYLNQEERSFLIRNCLIDSLKLQTLLKKVNFNANFQYIKTGFYHRGLIKNPNRLGRAVKEKARHLQSVYFSLCVKKSEMNFRKGVEIKRGNNWPTTNNLKKLLKCKLRNSSFGYPNY